MKKISFLLVFIVPFLGFSQRVQDQKITYSYIQLPLVPLDPSITTYQIKINAAQYEKNNQDSLLLYNSNLELCEIEFKKWIDIKQDIDKVFLLKMDMWQAGRNAGNMENQKPIKPPYPPIPLKEEIPYPLLTEKISKNKIKQSVSLQGYNGGKNGAIITITPLGFSNANLYKKRVGTGAAIRYNYMSSCKMPIKVKLEDPLQGVLLEDIIGNSISSKKLPNSFKSVFGFEAWKIDNLADYWELRQKQLLTSNINKVNEFINENCGYPLKTVSTEVFTVKKHKDYDYPDLIEAYTNAKQGFDLLNQDIDKKNSINYFELAIKIWEDMLLESNVAEKDSRVNEEVTALLYANLSQAYMWIDDFFNAESYIQKAKIGGKLKYKKFAKNLQPFLNSLKERHQANY